MRFFNDDDIKKSVVQLRFWRNLKTVTVLRRIADSYQKSRSFYFFAVDVEGVFKRVVIEKRADNRLEISLETASLQKLVTPCDLRIVTRAGKREKKLLCELGRVLGTSDIDGQISALELISRSAEQLTEKYGEEYRKKGRLYRSIGVLAGVTAGIMVI